MATTSTKPWGCVRVRPETASKLRKLARSRDLKHTAVVDALVRGWELLTPEQRERAFMPTGKAGVA